MASLLGCGSLLMCVRTEALHACQSRVATLVTDYMTIALCFVSIYFSTL